MIIGQFVIRSLTQRRCSLQDALSLCIRANAAACYRYKKRIEVIQNAPHLDLLQKISLPCALRTLDAHLVFHAIHFKRHVNTFEDDNNLQLERETINGKEFPIKRVDMSSRTQDNHNFLAEFVMNALFVRLTGSSKYLMSLIKEENSTLPGMNLDEWLEILNDLPKKKNDFINSQWTSKLKRHVENIPRIMKEMHELLSREKGKPDDFFHTRQLMFRSIKHIIKSKFVSSLVVADVEEFIANLWDHDEIDESTVFRGHGGKDGITVIDGDEKLDLNKILESIENDNFKDDFVSLLGFERDGEVTTGDKQKRRKVNIYRNICNGRRLSLVDVEHFSCKIFLVCDHLYGNRVHTCTDKNTSQYLHPIKFNEDVHPYPLVKDFYTFYDGIATEIINKFEDFIKKDEWKNMNLPRPFYNGEYFDEIEYVGVSHEI